MDSLTHAFPRRLLYLLFLVSTPMLGQIKGGGMAGFALNVPAYSSVDNPALSSVYATALGGYVGFRAQYDLNTRFALSNELTYQVLPYWNGVVEKVLYPSYLCYNILTSYAVWPKLILEAGLGTGITTVSKWGRRENNDPLFVSSFGARVPVGNWDISVRYYNFIRPLIWKRTGSDEITFRGQGVQVGVAYYLTARWVITLNFGLPCSRLCQI